MHILNEFFDRVVCLSLVEREDKYLHVKTQFDALGIDVEFHRAVIHPHNRTVGEVMTLGGVANLDYNNSANEYGCSREHYTIIKKAYHDGCRNICIFEDDISLRRNFNDLIAGYMSSVPEDWDLIMLNAVSGRSNFKRVNKLWVRAYKCYGTGAFALTRRGMEFYLAFQDNLYCQADRPLYEMQRTEGWNCYLPAKPLTIQCHRFTSDLRDEEYVPSSKYERWVKLKDFF